MNVKGLGGWVEIFRGGRQTDSLGREHDGDELIDRAVATFDSSKHEPPVVIGHPADNAPAWGWVEALKDGFRDGARVLLAKFRQVQPEFEDMVRRGLFKKRSAAFYADGSLRHVGFLGAAPPAVKGLSDVAFSAGAEASFEFSASDEAKKAQEARSKKYGIGIKEGGHVTKPSEWEGVPDEEFLDPVNYRYPCPDAEQTRAAAVYWARERNQAQYTPDERSVIEERLNKMRKKFNIGQTKKKEEKMNFKEFVEKLKDLVSGVEKEVAEAPAGKTFSEADIERAKKQAADAAAKAEREKVAAEFAERERQARKEARKKEISAWCESQLKAGKLTPAMVKFGLPEILEFLASSEEVIEFGEAKEKATLYERFKAFFETEVPKVVTFGEVATRDKDTGGRGAAGTKIDTLIREKMKATKDLSYSAAFAEVQRENPDLAREYQQEISA